MGVERVLQADPSGRAFLQHRRALGLAGEPAHAAYFQSLASPRRLAVLAEVEAQVRAAGAGLVADRLADLPELAGYPCFALDGHWHRAATHDARHQGKKMAVGHFYSLDLRTHLLRHLATGEGLHEHDTSALERVTPRGLKHGVPKEERVLLIYDKAGVDLPFWQRCRRETGVYFLSRIKENMGRTVLENRKVDPADVRNHGVQADQRVALNGGHELRLVTYTDPAGQTYQFLTNDFRLPPGLLAELYRRRWEIEKVFDALKNKLGGRRAWGSTLETRTTQALCLTLTHNLLEIDHARLAREHRVAPAAEDRRRAQRAEQLETAAQEAGRPLSPLLTAARQATQHSVKFVRWLMTSLAQNLAETLAVPRLQALYAYF
jgi:ribosomal protein L34